jgi:hypothetical protein
MGERLTGDISYTSILSFDRLAIILEVLKGAEPSSDRLEK